MIKVSCYKGLRKALLKTFEDEQWQIADKEHYGDEMPDFKKERFTIVASMEKRIVGFIFMTINAGVATVDSLLVDHQYRRKGIGTVLLQNAEKTAREEGCHMVRLETGNDWHAKSLYEKQGYSIRALLPQHYGKRDFVLMDKRLLTK